jgi:cysteine desulfurase
VLSAVEHDAVRVPALRSNHRILPVKADGRVDVSKLESLIDGRTVLVSVMYANNELGTIQPLRDIAKVISAIKKKRSRQDNALPLYFHTDACQAANYLPLLTNTLGVDLMTLNGGKIYGPKQSGILYVRTGTRIQAQVFGGGQERDLRSGTENVPAIIGFAAALTETAELRESEQARLRSLQQRFLRGLADTLPEIVINGSLDHRLPNNIHLTIPGADNERLLMELDERGLQVATGSACSASSDEPSHVLRAIGLTDADARASLRITFGRGTTEIDVDNLLRNLVALVAR